MIGRAKIPPPSGESTSAQLAALTDRHDQALTVIDRALRANRGNAQLADVLLDVRNALRPPKENDR